MSRPRTSPPPPTATDTPSALEAARARSHPRCFVCGAHHPHGIRMDFRSFGDGRVWGMFDCDPMWEGLEGRVHGGVLAALLDGAMSNCLLALGVVAVTADFQVRYLAPVLVGQGARVEARRLEQRGPLHDMEALLYQGRTLKARAKARFYDGAADPWSTEAAR